MVTSGIFIIFYLCEKERTGSHSGKYGDGIILGIGKGNAEWNYSAPHGSGRKLKRDKESVYGIGV